METNQCQDSITILVVDDDPITLKTISLTVKRAGYNTALANDGIEALEYLQNNRPNLIISDIMMPGMDGYTLLYFLKSDSNGSEIPVIFLTSRDSKEDIMDGINMGACNYLLKPFNPDELLACIKEKLSV